MEINTMLTRLGLEPPQGKLYLALLEIGPSTVAQLAHKAGLHRPTVYRFLPPLVQKGIVSQSTKGRRTLYVAEPPQKLDALLSQTKADLDQLIPQLEALAHKNEARPVVKILEGKTGIRFVFDDLVRTLKKGEVFYRFSSAVHSRDTYLSKTYRDIRDTKQLERFVITNVKQAQSKRPRLERAMKIVPAKYGLFDHDVTQVIYGNKVAFIDYPSETAVLIENSLIAKFQRDLFRIIYDKI